ncbi:hypothetical protein [Treponema sp. UBA3813]|uniref:hypothetical protein n=1 Tax=Treponema sp. UBA3813 TaxID=1947715 RepID=UPI0025D73C10|nr:hypothetical protein [Treponema sp. UBA3813]
MKKLVRNLTGSFVALLLLAGMFSCSNGDDLDTDDPFVEANIINPANKGGGAQNPESSGLTKESIISGIQSDDNVWGSGTKITKNDTYTVTHGTGWDPSGMATIPVCFTKGDLSGYTHIVVELDTKDFIFRDGSDEYPSFELKVEDENKNSKVINATNMFNKEKGVAEIPLASVDFLDTASQCTVNLRGTGKVIFKGIYKAK